MLTPYATEWLEPSKLLISKAKGGDVANATAVHAAYQLVGVAAGKLLPDGPAAYATPLTDEETAVLEDLCKCHGLADFTVNWKVVLQVALDIIAKLLLASV